VSDRPPPSPLPPALPPDRPKGRGLGWFFAVSGTIVLVLTLGCVLAVSGGLNDNGALAILCGSPTFLLGGLFLWLGTRRLKR